MLRRANSEDVAEIYEILSQTLSPWSLEGVKSSVEKDFALVYVSDKIEGIIFFSKVCDECELLNFAVRSNHRGKGIGEMLLLASFEDEFFIDVSTAFLEVRESNIPAVSLYKKHGFKEIAKRKNYYKNPTENAIIMQKHF